jgi:hypothetical protein
MSEMLPDLSSVGFDYVSRPEGEYQVLNISIDGDQVTLELRELTRRLWSTTKTNAYLLWLHERYDITRKMSSH